MDFFLHWIQEKNRMNFQFEHWVRAPKNKIYPQLNRKEIRKNIIYNSRKKSHIESTSKSLPVFNKSKNIDGIPKKFKTIMEISIQNIIISK